MKSRFLILFLLFVLLGNAQKLPDLIPFRQGDLWGYSDSNKQIIITPQYDQVNLFYGSCAIVSDFNISFLINKKNNKIDSIKKPFDYFIDNEKQQIVIYKRIVPPCGEFKISNDTPSIIIYNFEGKLLKTYFNTDISLLYDSQSGFVHNCNPYEKLNSTFYTKRLRKDLSNSNDWVYTYQLLVRMSDSAIFDFKQKYLFFEPTSNCNLVVGMKHEGTFDIIDSTGKILIKELSGRISKDYFYNTDYSKSNYSKTIVNLSGDTINGLKYDYLESTSKDNTLFAYNDFVSNSHPYRTYDIIELFSDTFKILKSFQADMFRIYSQDQESQIALFTKGNKVFMVNKDLDIFEIPYFKRGFIKNAKSKLPQVNNWNYIEVFNDGFIFNDFKTKKNAKKMIEQNKEMKGIINEKGKLVFTPQYEFVLREGSKELFNFGLLTIKDNGKQGLVNNEGKIILKPEKYKSILAESTNLFVVSNGNFLDWFYVDYRGVEYYAK